MTLATVPEKSPPPRPPRPPAGAPGALPDWRRRSVAVPARARRAAAASSAGLVGERERHFDLGVLRECLGSRHVYRAARAIDAIGGRSGAERAAGAVSIAHEEIGSVHQHAAIALGGDGEAPQHGLGEGIFYRAAFGGIGAGGPEVLVALHHQDTRSHALEGDDLAPAFLSAIEADIIGAQSRRETRRVQHRGIEAGDLQPQIARALLPIDREKAIELRHAGGALLDGRDARGRLRGASTAGLLGVKSSDYTKGGKKSNIGKKTSGNYYTRQEKSHHHRSPGNCHRLHSPANIGKTQP